MIKELYQIKNKELALNITNNLIDSVRKKNLTKSGCRVYDKGCIGVAGILGEPTKDTWKQAEQALSLSIPYPCEPGKNLKKHRITGSFVEEATFISQAEQLLQTLTAEFPGFIFSQKIVASEDTVILKNDAGLDLLDTQCFVTVCLVIKDEFSPNIFDTFIEWRGEHFDVEAVLERGRDVLRAHRNPLPLPKEPIPVLMTPSTITEILGDYLHARKLKKGASLLSGREHTKVFSERLTLNADRRKDAYIPFFDAEGTVIENECTPLIEKGVLLHGLADKISAQEFSMELTASAEGNYDDIPTLQVDPLALQLESNGTLAELLGAQDAIYICMASGGDITPVGDYATPVQVAYLCRNGKLVGKLPEFSIRGNISHLLGKNYIGTSSDRCFDSQSSVALYCHMEA